MSKPVLPPTIIFIFGGGGDLTRRKLIPALYNLYLNQQLPEKYCIVGIGRSAIADESYRSSLLEGIKEHSRRKNEVDSVWPAFSKQVFYQARDLQNDASYEGIFRFIKEKEAEWKETPNVMFYLSVAPQLAPAIATRLSAHRICDDEKHTRIVFEKPFGHDLQSAHDLNVLLASMFKEEQIYRIDHYLGKETVQNILAFRFANQMFEPIWNNNYIDHVQITAAETVGVEDRGGYYEQAGALRDMVQNHVLQLLCMIAMEPPTSFDSNEIRNKKVDVLKAIRKIDVDDVHENAVRGQYAGGWMKGKEVKGYREEKNVGMESPVETFVAARFFVDNWRWKDVPFYIRTGKRMHEKTTSITIQFKEAPHYSFPAEAADTWRANRLTFSIQPQMDIRIRFQAKRPGTEMVLNPVDMVFSYADTFDGQEPEAYETLLEDVIEGNQTLFMRADQVEIAWQVITPMLEAWQKRPPVDFPNYSPDSWGPEDGEALIARDGHFWANLAIQNKKEVK
ncbi:MAG TPA: glucose-6-phosphate dehydrogenase [Chitinophagaceae bacterium]|nr:glucose-6-phosphate dehydrogenase [Chitinophagaceae bacterium]